MPFVKLNSKQIEKIADLFGNIGLLILASLTIPVFSNSRDVNLARFLVGVLVFVGCSIESVLLMGGEEDG